MALQYKRQARLEKLAKATSQTLTNNRLSDLSRTLFGGRGGGYDEWQYLRQQNGDTDGVNDALSDAWIKFSSGKGTSGVNRADQAEREFFEQKTF